MNYEYELIRHSHHAYFNVFIVEMYNRNIHYHSDFEILLNLGPGGMHASAKGDCLIFEKDEMFVLNPLDVHGFFGNSQSTRLLCLQLNPKLFREAFPHKNELRFYTYSLRDIPKAKTDLLRELLLEFAYCFFSDEGDFNHFRYVGFFNLLIYQLLTEAPNCFLSDEKSRTTKLRDARLIRITEYIEENHTLKIALSDLAEAEGVSTGYLSHFILNNLHCSFQDYVTSVRLEHAKSLIALGKRPSEASFEAGFSDPRYLSKAFLRFIGCTPDEFSQGSARSSASAVLAGNRDSERIFTKDDALAILDGIVGADLR